MKKILDYKEYASVARLAAAEGMVLLKNNNNTLPLEKDEVLNVFGRTQYDTIYSGTGSGGSVNVPYVININEALKEEFSLNKELDQMYKEWLIDNPFDHGEGWAQTPFSQKEMEISEEQIKKVSNDYEVAIFVIGRVAGEDKDNEETEGAYYLSATEKNILSNLRKHFKKLVVIINAGNLIDLSWDLEINADSILYAWQGGCETGNSVADILSGRVNPSGKLPSTVIKDLDKHPAKNNFGKVKDNYYYEDIFVGYRYFETFSKENVLYPFGFGLSYTDFNYEFIDAEINDNELVIKGLIKNIGNLSGKTVLQLYVGKPQTDLGNPAIELKRFYKTDQLEPNASQEFVFKLTKEDFKSYDDRKDSANAFSYVLEKGQYNIFLGFNARDIDLVHSFALEKTETLERLRSNLSPNQDLIRLKASKYNDQLKLVDEKIEANKYSIDYQENIEDSQNKTIHYYDELIEDKVNLDDFVDQFSNEQLLQLSMGNGMGPKLVTAGVASAFGGVTKELRQLGIPLIACSDGPSGIRLDNGDMAFSLPNGTCLAATFNVELNEKLFSLLALEMKKNNVQVLLGPGINIHRHPLCGRNFEYFSEDPYLTGSITVAQIKALSDNGVSGTIKHFALNNQEKERFSTDSVVSERAAREIYLKPFEIAVKSGYCDSIMTSYNLINGIHGASNEDLTKNILREEWGYEGIVMTDWWAHVNSEPGSKSNKQNYLSMIRAENDLYMVVTEAEDIKLDEVLEVSGNEKLNRDQLKRNVKNILCFIKKYQYNAQDYEVKVINEPEGKKRKPKEIELSLNDKKDLSEVITKKGYGIEFNLNVPESGKYYLRLNVESFGLPLSQMGLYVACQDVHQGVINLSGTQEIERYIEIATENKENYKVNLYFSESGMSLKEAELIREEDVEKDLIFSTEL